MSSEEESQGNHDRPEMELPPSEDLRWFLEGVESETEKLRIEATSLPPVEPDGSSECPDAEQRYAQKEKTEAELTEQVETLRTYISQVEQELLRAQGDWARINGDKARLHQDPVIEEYSQAELELEAECFRWAQVRDEMLRVLSGAEVTLGISRTKKYPGKIPEDEWGEPAVPSHSDDADGDSETPAITSDPEFEGLLSLEPTQED